MKKNIDRFMQVALEEATTAAHSGEVPVGAIIVDSKSNTIIAQARNLIITMTDPTAHAEILAIKKATNFTGTIRLSHCDLYVTLEPCPMCAQAISFARLRRVYFGAYDPKGGGIDHGPRIFEHKTCHHKPEVIGGFYETDSANLLRNFFSNLR